MPVAVVLLPGLCGPSWCRCPSGLHIRLCCCCATKQGDWSQFVHGEEVEDGEKQEREESHDDEVGQEYVVSGVGEAEAEFRWTDGRTC